MSKAKGVENAEADLAGMPFEEALRRLEAIVEAMEGQDLPLEQLLTRYEEGSRLAQICQAKLNEAEVKIQQLDKNSKGEIVVKNLTPETLS